MKKQPDTLTGLKTGYNSKNRWNAEFNKFNNSKPTKAKDKTYPNGIIPIIFITVTAIIVLGLCLGLTKNIDIDPNKYLASEWFNIVWYILGAVMCLYALWAIGRTGFFSVARFGMLKFSRKIKFNIFKTKIKIQPSNCAIEDVHTLEDWNVYLNERKVHTKKAFLISLIVFSSLFVLSTIIMIVLNAV